MPPRCRFRFCCSSYIFIGQRYTHKARVKHYLIIGAWFGGFQALMPTIGYFLGSTFEQYITAFDDWVAFVLLAAIGANMIKESFSREESETSASFAFKTMLLMAMWIFLPRWSGRCRCSTAPCWS